MNERMNEDGKREMTRKRERALRLGVGGRPLIIPQFTFTFKRSNARLSGGSGGHGDCVAMEVLCDGGPLVGVDEWIDGLMDGRTDG